MPYVAQVAVGKLPKLRVFGNDYPTPDGTGVRDYIHVVDLAKGHLAALDKLRQAPGLVTYNLGTGRGYSVLEMVAAFERASGRPVPYEIVARRPGDIATCYADPTLAREELGWQARARHRRHGVRHLALAVREPGRLWLTRLWGHLEGDKGSGSIVSQRKSSIRLSGSSSKSGEILTRPLASPRRRWTGSDCTGTSRTTGLFPRAIIISSPASARATKAESCVVASWMLTMAYLASFGG